MADSSAQNLTGAWHGQYSYAGVDGPVAFTADVVEIGGQISGGTSETGATRTGAAAQFRAALSGRRSGHNVAFTKIYDGSGGWHHSVDYDGVLSADGTEIEGQWRIPGKLTGKFLMIRPLGKTQSVTKRVAERV